MNGLRSYGCAALTTLSVLAAALPAAGCAAHPVSASSQAHRPDSGIAGCTALLRTRPVATTGYPKIRSQFARSQWPYLRAAGTSYIDLLVKLQSARGTDGYEAVWFYQRLSSACASHGWRQPPADDKSRLRRPAENEPVVVVGEDVSEGECLGYVSARSGSR